MTNKSTKKISADTQKFTQERFNYYRQQVDILLKKLILVQGEEESILAQIQEKARTNKLQDTESRYSGANTDKALAYALIKNRNTLLEYSNEKKLAEEYQALTIKLENAYEEAYSLIHSFRQEFNNTITYTFLFPGENGELYEAHVPEKMLMPLMEIQVNNKAKSFERMFKLKITNNKEVLIAFQQYLQELQQSSSNEIFIEAVQEENNAIYKLVMGHQHKNFGNKYEAYRALIASFNGLDKALEYYENSPDLFIEKMNTHIDESKKNNLKWTHGGDIGDVQVKAIGASVTTGTTLINTLQSMKQEILGINEQGLPSKTKEEIATAITRLFGDGSNFEKKVLTAAETKAFEKAKKEVLDILKL